MDQHCPPARQNQTRPTQRTDGVINVDLHLATQRVINATQTGQTQEIIRGIREFLLVQRRIMEELEEDEQENIQTQHPDPGGV